MMFLIFFFLQAISCGIPPHPKNGAIDGSRFTFGSKVMFRQEIIISGTCNKYGKYIIIIGKKINRKYVMHQAVLEILQSIYLSISHLYYVYKYLKAENMSNTPSSPIFSTTKLGGGLDCSTENSEVHFVEVIGETICFNL